MSAVAPLAPSQQVLAPSEVIYDVDKFFPGRRSTLQVQTTGGTGSYSQGSQLTFTIPSTSDQAIDCQTLHMHFDHTSTNAVMHEGAFSLIDSVEISSGTGVVLSRIQNYAQLMAILADTQMDDAMRASLWSQGYGPVETRSAGVTRSYAIPLKGFFDNHHFIYPSWFGGLIVTVTLRALAESHTLSGGAGSQSYSLSKPRLMMDVVALDPQNTMQLNKRVLSKGIQLRFTGYTYQGQPLGAGTSDTISISNRNKSQNAVIVAFQKPDAVDKTYDRSDAGVLSWQFRAGTMQLPASPVTTKSETMTEISHAFHGAVRGKITYSEFVPPEGKKYFIARNLRVFNSRMSGNSESSLNSSNLDLYLTRKSDAPVVQAHCWVSHDVIVDVRGTTLTVWQ